MPRFRPIRPSRVSEEVTEQLKQSILLGDFKAGDKLPPERSLAEEFQVSRVAVREALRTPGKLGIPPYPAGRERRGLCDRPVLRTSGRCTSRLILG